MKKYLMAAVAACAIAPAANAASLISAQVTGPTGTVWNTAQDSFYTLFLMRPVGNVINPTDNFTSTPTTEGMNNFVILGEGFRPGESANSDPSYMLTLTFADGATISGSYVGSSFVAAPGNTATAGNTTYTLNGFGWDRSRADNVSAFSAVSGGDPADYTGQFSYSAITAAVPEPATWAMFVLGFGILGGAMRTRARNAGVMRKGLIAA